MNAPLRQCGDCQLCCRLLPVRELRKAAGKRCINQHRDEGCKVHGKLSMPMSCRLWSCRWLVNDDTDDQLRPNHSHYVIDIMPDYVTYQNNETGHAVKIAAVQIWIDPKHPDAHRDPALRRYLERRAAQGIVAVVRYDSQKALILIAPEMADDNEWHEITHAKSTAEHSAAEIIAATETKK